MEKLIGNTTRLKELNTERLRSEMQRLGSATKRRLAENTGLSIASCGNILADMLKTGEIAPGELSGSDGGRPARQYRYNFHFHTMLLLHLGVEDGIRTITAVVADSVGHELARRVMDVPQITPALLCRTLGEFLTDYPSLAAVSISYPGVVNDGRTDAEVGDLKELFDCDLKSCLESRFPVRVAVENDMNLAALGYFRDRQCPEDSSLSYVAFFVLPGCGSIVNGKLLRGGRGFAGEVTWLPFDLSPAEYAAMQQTPDGAIRLASKTILALTAILNPDTVVLCGKLLAGRDLQAEVVAGCRLPQINRFLPEIVFTDDWMADIMNGLRERAADLLRCRIQLIAK